MRMLMTRRDTSGDTAPFDGPTLMPASDTVLTDADLVPEVVIALTLLDLLDRVRTPMRLGEIACALDISASATHDLCELLLSQGYLQQASDGSLSLGPSRARLALNFPAVSTPDDK